MAKTYVGVADRFFTKLETSGLVSSMKSTETYYFGTSVSNNDDNTYHLTYCVDHTTQASGTGAVGLYVINLSGRTESGAVYSTAYFKVTGVSDDGYLICDKYSSFVTEVAHKVKKMYVGVDGVAKKVKKAYMGVDGVARKIYSTLEWDPILENNSWEVISEVSKEGLASTIWNIGDQKTIYVNGVAYLVDIIGFDHDTPTDTTTYGRGKVGITFQLHDLLETTYPMNNTNTTVGGWKDSYMRTNTMPTLLGQLNSDLQKVIVPVDKKTGEGGGATSGLITTSDSLFLLSATEVIDDVSYWISDQGSHYEHYYPNADSRIKLLNGTASAWFTRSPYPKSTTMFALVTKNGGYTHEDAKYKNGVSFGFCV